MKKFTSIIEEKEEYGIFFRLPIQDVYYDTYNEDESCYSWFEKAKKNIFIRLINKNVFNNFEEWDEDFNFAGITAKTFCSPIYFKRNVRRALHVFNDDHNVKYIKSFGEEPYKNSCGGSCICERTIIKFKNGMKKVVKIKDAFHYCYKHIVEEEFC